MDSDHANRLAELEERLRFESLIADLSSNFINLPAAEVDGEIMEAQRRVCEVLDLDISAIWQWSDGSPGFFTLTHFYSAQDGPQPSTRLNQEDFPWFLQLMLEGRIVPISSLDDMPAEAAYDRENCRRLGIKSNLCIPLAVGGGPPIGILGLNTTRAERDWPEAQVRRLQLLAQIFANALARKLADLALREGEERMVVAAEAAKFGMWAWSIAINRVWGSERWLRLFGFAAGEDLSFEEIIRQIHPDDRAVVEREVRHAVADGTDYAGDFRVVLPDGTQRWIASRGRAYPDNGELPARMLGAVLDVTERKRSEEALRSSEARLAAGVELAGLGYYEVDFVERTFFADAKLQELCGLPAGQQDLQPLEYWTEHLHPDDRQRVLDERQKSHNGAIEGLSTEYRYLHPSEGTRWLHHAGRVTKRDASGRALRTYGVIRDITTRRQAQMDALDLGGRLLRSQEVERARIAKELHDGLSQNLALLSVELEMFGQRLPAAAAEILARLGEFSQQTKALSAEVHRIAHGLHPAKLTQLGLAVALQSHCREIEPAHGFSMDFQTHEVPRELPEDVALCLYRVTQEALHNIAKHSGATHARVELAGLDDALTLTITDDGRGFVMGTGRNTGSLGLVSMHERVRLVLGKIAVTSQPGAGTRIEVRVPLTKGPTA